MITKYYSKAKFIFLLGAVVSLSCCTSSNKVASSFNKRKYVKGHFSDPVVQQKTEVSPSYGSSTIVADTKQPQRVVMVKNTSFSQTSQSIAKAKPVVSKSTSSTPGLIGIAKAAIATNIANNISLKQNSSVQEYVGYGNGGAHNGGGRTRSYLITCLICLGICLVLNILDGVLGLAVLGTISWIFGIAAVVFFILWVFSLSL